MAVFVTSPSDNSNAVYSFSGYSPASEIVDCYLNDKSPPCNPHSKLGFWWEDPDLYRNCEDLSDLNIIEDRLEKMKKHIIACIEKKERKTPSFCSLEDKSSSLQIVASDQNPSLGENRGDQTYSQTTTSSDHQNHGKSLSELCSLITFLDDGQSPSKKSHDGEFSIDELVNNNYMLGGLNDDFCLDNHHPMNNYEVDDDINISQFLNDEAMNFSPFITA